MKAAPDNSNCSRLGHTSASSLCLLPAETDRVSKVMNPSDFAIHDIFACVCDDPSMCDPFLRQLVIQEKAGAFDDDVLAAGERHS